MKALRPPTSPIPPEADQALRTLFAQQVGEVPAAADIAGIAVRRARRISRRRTSIGGVAAALAFVLTLGTAVSMRGWWASDSTNNRTNGASATGLVQFDAEATGPAVDYSPVALRVDVSVDNRIWDSAAGQWLPTGGTGPATVVRVPQGWLAGDSEGVRFVRYDGTTIPVVSGDAAWTVNGDGSKIAVVSGTTLSVSDVTGHGAIEVATTVVPGGETPIGFAASTVLLSTPAGSIDTWRPGGARSESQLRYVYTSALSQTVGVVASPDSGRPCLATVAAESTGVRQVAVAGCHGLLAQGIERAATSPDGRYLAMPFDGGMWIINVARSVEASAADPSAPPVWVATCASDRDSTPVWQDAKTVVTSAHGALISCGVDGVQRDVRLPEGVSVRARLIPRRVVA